LYQSTYFIDKSTNTFSDNLAAFGLAFVLNAIADGRAKVRMEDKGYAFAVICEPTICEEWVEKCDFFAGAPLLVTIDSAATKKQGKIIKTIKGTKLDLGKLPQPDGYSFLDYQFEKQNKDDYFAWMKSLSKEDKKKWRAGAIQPTSFPHPNWEIFRAINPAALQSYNLPIGIWWMSQSAFPDLLKILLAMTSSMPNDVASAEKTWVDLCRSKGLERSKSVTANQITNPSQGKGNNSSKAEWRIPGNMDNFWLLEWLKTVGLFHGSYTRNIANPKDPRNAKDRKTYVLSPFRLGWSEHQGVMKHFRQAMNRSETAIKMDVLVSLRYAQAFLKFYEEARAEDLSEDIFGHPPSDLVNGLQMAYYKNLGNSPAVMNIATVNLPRWVAPHDRAQLADFQTSLEEHIAIIRAMDETRGEQFALLSQYRDFISGDRPDSFFEFSNAYSGFAMSQMERKKFVRLFSIPTLEVLFMNHKDKSYSEIMQSEGFRNIAYAIRHSTVTLQKAKRLRRPATNIRYGLGQQLARKAAYPAEFLAELSEFLHLYNAENAQLREKDRNPFRKDVRMEDIEEIVSLVDRFGSKVVCNMLVAFGYASEARPKDAPKEDDDQIDEDQSGDDETTEEE
jgi:hypothetical protein